MIDYSKIIETIASDLFLLIVGVVVTFFATDRYSRFKDKQEIRNKLMTVYTDADLKFQQLVQYWYRLRYFPTPKSDNITEYDKKRLDEIEDAVVESIPKVVAAIGLLKGLISVYFEVYFETEVIIDSMDIGISDIGAIIEKTLYTNQFPTKNEELKLTAAILAVKTYLEYIPEFIVALNVKRLKGKQK